LNSQVVIKNGFLTNANSYELNGMQSFDRLTW